MFWHTNPADGWLMPDEVSYGGVGFLTDSPIVEAYQIRLEVYRQDCYHEDHYREVFFKKS